MLILNRNIRLNIYLNIRHTMHPLLVRYERERERDDESAGG